MSTQREKLLKRLEAALIVLADVMLDILRYHHREKKDDHQITLGFRTAAQHVWELVLWGHRADDVRTDRALQDFCKEAIERMKIKVKG
jgi:hypothetical protein